MSTAPVETVVAPALVVAPPASSSSPPPQLSQPPLPPNTTEQEDITTASQRRVNLIWEYTQAIIALTVVMTTMARGFMLNSSEQIPTIMAVAFGTVVGFYFSRTNHAAIGGVGHKPSQTYIGR